jgi:phage terminase large subunit
MTPQIDWVRLAETEGVSETLDPGSTQADDDGKIRIEYLPRKHFRALHDSQKRWMFVCAHRRAGKTVALANQLIRAGMRNRRFHPKPRYAYVGPSFDQAKDLVWGYLKQYTESIPHTRYMEGELTCILPTRATIKLYGGAAAYERMRGMYFDGIVLDEYPLLHPSVFSTVVRPCLADYGGWAVISGTSNGDDHFNQLRLRTEEDPRWDQFIIPLTMTGEEALSHEEAAELTQDMSPEEYAREMLCSFDAPVEGSYYGDILNQIGAQGRITNVPVDLTQPVITGWDLGIHDYTCIWLYQICGREVHFIDYIENNGKSLDFYTRELQLRARNQGYHFKCHCLPHDVEARELATGQSRRQVLYGLLDEPVLVAPLCSPDDGVAAARGIMGASWFDDKRCKRGLSALRAYRRSKFGKPLHGPESHAADAFKTAATSFHMVSGLGMSLMRAPGRLRRRIRGML